MSKLTALVLDGPCAGSYDVRRATKRMVFTAASDGKTYALDEDGDVVLASERAFVYETDGSVGWLCGRGPGLPARTVTFTLAARLDAATGEVLELSPEELAAEREAGRKRVIAWAFGDDMVRLPGAAPEPAAAPSTAAPVQEAPVQEALFT